MSTYTMNELSLPFNSDCEILYQSNVCTLIDGLSNPHYTMSVIVKHLDKEKSTEQINLTKEDIKKLHELFDLSFNLSLKNGHIPEPFFIGFPMDRCLRGNIKLTTFKQKDDNTKYYKYKHTLRIDRDVTFVDHTMTMQEFDILGQFISECIDDWLETIDMKYIIDNCIKYDGEIPLNDLKEKVGITNMQN